MHNRQDQAKPVLQSDLRTALRRLERAGLILTKERFAAEAALAERERLRQTVHRTGDSVPESRPLGIAIESYGDLQQVRRAVSSWLNRAPGSPVSVYSYSTSDGPLHACLEAIQGDRAKETLRSLRFAGNFEFETFFTRLSAETRARGVPDGVLSFALRGRDGFGRRTGANRNRALLDHAGSAVILCDETGSAECFRVGRENALELSSRSDPAQMYVDTPRTVLPVLAEIDGGIREAHQSMLGRPGRDLALEAAANRTLSLPPNGTACLESLFRFSPHVVATVAGVYGDAGAEARRRILRLEGRFRTPLMAGRSAYESAIASRRLLWATETRVLSDSGCLRAGNVGLDLQTLLPPFLPSGGNNDGVFGLLVSKCHPPGSIAHLTAAFRREPHTGSRYERSGLTRVQVRISDIMSFLIRDVGLRPWPASTSHRSDPAAAALRKIGAQLYRVAHWSPENFEEYVEELWLRRASQEIEELSGLLDRYGESPQFWARDVKDTIRAIEELTFSGSPAVPADMNLPIGTTRRERIVRCQQFVGSFACLLHHWPEIVAVASEMKRAGIRISQEV